MCQFKVKNMILKVKKLALLTMPGIVALSLAACGGGSSGSGSDTPPQYDTTKESFFDTGTGEPTAPSGVTAPTADPAEPASGKLIVQYMDDNYGTRGSLASEGMTLNLHLWDNGCDVKIAPPYNSDWDDTSLVPTSQNEYGVVWEFDITDAAADGCTNVIIRNASKDKLGNGSDQKLIWTADDHTITFGTKEADSFLSSIDAFNAQYSAAFEPADASAHFISKNVIAWGSADKDRYGANNIRLQYNPDGLVAATDGQLNGQHVDLAKIDPTDAMLVNHQNLQNFNFYQISDEDAANLDLKKMLKGEMVVVGLDGDNKVKTGSLIQTAGLIDDLYAEAALNEELGTKIDSTGVTFKLWAPTARSVKVHIWPSDGSYSTDANADMTFDENTGVWSYTAADAGHGSIYKYEVDVYHPATRTIEDTWTTDPYTLTLTGGNSVVVDFDHTSVKPAGWDSVTAPHSQATPADIAAMFITESHIRDLTVGPDKGIPLAKQGKYVGLLDSTTAIGQHLKDLSAAGVTHMEFLPFYDIASISEDNVFNNKVADETLPGTEFCAHINVTATEGINVCNSSDTVLEQLAVAAADDSVTAKKLDTFLNKHVKTQDNYNWGYDPWHYGAPEGSYATDKKPMTRIMEIRQLIQSMKSDYGFNVIMDVVYNHTNAVGVEDNTSVLDRIVPWYYNRLNAQTGKVNEDTCCSDTASEHKMFAKLMEDTLVIWARDYKIDAFRFDLMGYIPKDVMTQTLANVKSRTGNNEIYFFGEGWDAGSAAAVVGSENNATQINMHGTGIGTFNDRLRDGIRGNGPFDHGDSLIKLQGFATGRCSDMNDKRLELDPDYSCAIDAKNSSDYGMHPLNWQDIIRIAMAGNLRDYPLETYTGDVKLGKDISYWGPSAGYGDSPIETINYVSKHDNQTIFDMIMYKAKKDRSMEEKAQMQGIALASVILGQSPIFDQQGSDLLRTKFFQNDSYNTGDFGNGVNYNTAEGNGFIPKALINYDKDKDDWNAIVEVGAYNSDPGASTKAKMVDTYKKLAKIRAENAILHFGDAEKIKQNVKFLNVGTNQIPGVIAMKVTNPDDAQKALYVVLNARPSSEFTLVGEGTLSALDTGALYDGKCTLSGDQMTTGAWSVCVFKQN